MHESKTIIFWDHGKYDTSRVSGNGLLILHYEKPRRHGKCSLHSVLDENVEEPDENSMSKLRKQIKKVLIQSKQTSSWCQQVQEKQQKKI